MQKWEYKILSFGWDMTRMSMYWFDIDERDADTYNEAVTKRLNAEGELGWELVSVEKVEDSENSLGQRYYFLKRLIG